MEKVMEGVVMEVEDYASPHVASITCTSSPLTAFNNCHHAILVGAMPRKEGMQRKDLLKANAAIFKLQGQALDRVAHHGCKVVVVGNPANTNAYIVAHYAESLPRENITALTRLDQNRAQALVNDLSYSVTNHLQLAKKLKVPLEQVSNVVVWGNHSNTQFPDVSHTQANGSSVKSLLNSDYITQEFIPTVQNRGAQVIAARKLSSAMSAAKAIADHLHSLIHGTPSGQFVSMAVVSDGSYGSPAGIYFSLPCLCTGTNSEYEIVQGLEMNEDARDRIALTAAELLAEREEAELCLVGSPDLTPCTTKI